MDVRRLEAMPAQRLLQHFGQISMEEIPSRDIYGNIRDIEAIFPPCLQLTAGLFPNIPVHFIYEAVLLELRYELSGQQHLPVFPDPADKDLGTGHGAGLVVELRLEIRNECALLERTYGFRVILRM